MIVHQPLTGAQLRAARAMLRWTAENLATNAQVGVATIRRAEATDGPIRALASITLALRQTLETAGVELIPEDGSGAGVKLRPRHEVKQPGTRVPQT